MEKIRIIIVDDHVLLREGWCILLDSDPRFSVVSIFGRGEEVIEKALGLKPDVIIMDINMPGINGIETTKIIHEKFPSVKVLGVSQHARPAYALKMMKEGAKGYLTKSSTKKELFRAISEIHEGRQYVCEEIKSLFFEQTVEERKDPNWLRKLTKREVQVVKSLKEGFSSIEIGSQLDLSTRTVEVHRHNILKKLGLKNTAALIDLIYKSEIYIDM